ncbi:hypothetical protein [Streptomyces sp. NPDC059787]|uniref:hypothetical protein n=1 Tax=Streptomyces sp. NPDC059787 TaxID=3346947 RepID=UPI003654EB43
MESASRTARARLAALTRHRGEDDPDVVQARHDYTRRFTREQLHRILGPQTPETRAELVALVLEDEGAATT